MTATTTTAPTRGQTRTTVENTAPTRQRRPRWLLWVGILIVALSALLGSFLFRAGQSTQTVLLVQSPLVPGQPISEGQLATTTIPATTALTTVPADQLKSIVGRYATLALPTGSLLTPDAATTSLTPPAGQRVVGIGVKSTQAPIAGLVGGQKVRVVVTYGAGGAGATAGGIKPADSWPGTVVAASKPNNVGVSTIDVQVAASDAPSVAAAAGSGNIALVLDSSAG